MKCSFLIVAALLAILGVDAKTTDGAITADMLQRMRQSYAPTAADRALRNAINNVAIDQLAANADNAGPVDTHFTYKVDSKGITDQKSSGRCWLFSGYNVLRSQMMADHQLPELKLSQAYGFFYDQLEKANLFLQGVIDTAGEPVDSRRVDFLFQSPVSDGGQFTTLSDMVMKYGVVPSEVMPETTSSESTSRIRQLVNLKLREDGLRLRDMAAKGAKKGEMAKEKERMLTEIYRMLVMAYGQPPTEFTWTRRDAKGNAIDTRSYTPQEFYREYAGNDLQHDYILLMNDPTRPYYRLYEIEMDRSLYDGANWTYVNLPMEAIKQMAVESLKDSTMMYFSCDVGQCFDRKRGLLDVDNYDYGSLFGVDFGMDKRERILTHASASTHAMTLMAVDLDADGKPVKWMVENSWGPGANDGHLVITDPWMDEYMFRLVVEKKYAPAEVLEVLKQKPTLLPPWDPMFTPDE